MNSALSELGFASRQALIVVPHHRATGHLRGQVSSDDGHWVMSGTDSSNSGSGGYFGYVKWILPYMNPFSYLGGNASSSSSETTSNDSLWQYRESTDKQVRGHHPASLLLPAFICVALGLLTSRLGVIILHPCYWLTNYLFIIPFFSWLIVYKLVYVALLNNDLYPNRHEY